MTGWTPEWDVLREAIGGEVIVPGAAGYEVARKPALARFQCSRPQAVVLATTATDVAETIVFGRRFGLRTTPRSGGHCFAGRSSTGDIIIDVTPMRSVSVSNGVAVVGAGARLGDLYDALAVHGRTIPAGCGPSVGIVGLTLGGGLGILGRQYGLTCDHLLSARVVLADGRIVECDEHHEGELFWALRGAGSHLGVVTSLVFATVPLPTSSCFHLTWSPVHAAAVVDAWQTWAPTAPDELDANLRLTASGSAGRSPAVSLFGAMLGADTGPLLGEFVARVGANPATEFRRRMPYRDVKRQLSAFDVTDTEPGQPQQGHMFSKSEFFRRPLPRHAVTAVLDNLTEGCAPDQSRVLNLTPWGGAYNRVPADATAFVHRDELFMIEHVVTVGPAVAGTERAAARAWLARSWASVHPWGSGRVYPNFPDLDLEDWADAYFGTNHDRLLRAKRTYDPDTWFRFPQSLGSPGTRIERTTHD